MSAWRVSFAAPSTEYWSIHWSSTNSPTLTSMKFCSFSCSCFPSSTQSSFLVSLRQTHIPLPKVCFGQRPGTEAGCFPRWETATLLPGHWGETVQTSALCQAVSAPGLCSLPLSLSPRACRWPVLLAVHITCFQSPPRKMAMFKPPASQMCPTGCWVKSVNLEGLRV